MSDKAYIKSIEADNERLQKENDSLKEEVEILKSELGKFTEQQYRDDGKYDTSEYDDDGYKNMCEKAIQEANDTLSRAWDQETKFRAMSKYENMKRKKEYDKWWSNDYDDEY